MPSTYTGLGVQLMTTGEKAGTWGTLTNTNWDIIEQISGGYVSIALNTTGATTLAVSDGAATDANQVAHKVMNFTAALGGNVTVTIPLDVQNVYIIKNSTTEAYSVEFKYVSGSGSSVTWASGDRGTKIVYATANDGTNPDIVDATSAFVTATSSTTLSNKTLTEPKFVNGGFIADANGLEMLVFDTVASALNEVKITNAATGTAGPIIASQGESNSNLQLRPSGTGMITTGTAAAHSTISSNGAYNLILSTNEGSSSGTITITDAANGDITLTPNGTGEVQATDAADATAAVKIAGKETMWIPATAFYLPTTNPAEAATVETTAVRPELKVLDFDASTNQYAQFAIAMPKSWDLGVVTFQAFWSPSSTDTGDMLLGLQGVGVANDATSDVTFDAAVDVTDTAGGAVEDVMVSPVSGNVTVKGVAADTYTYFQVARNATSGSDTFTGDVRLLGIKLFYTTDAANDA